VCCFSFFGRVLKQSADLFFEFILAVTLCLCGGGRIGTVHLRDLVNNPRVKLVAIVEVIESRRKVVLSFCM
jgi:hypothetical protein